MPRAQKITRDKTVAGIEDYLDKPRLLHVVCYILEHDYNDDKAQRCYCCGSDLAKIVNRVEVGELLIDVGKKSRVLRTDENSASFDEIANRAHRVDLPIRCSRYEDPESHVTPVDTLFDFETKTTSVSGGNRSGKSTLGVNWFAIRWLFRGGKNRLFRLMGPELKQAHILKSKLVDGENLTPPVLPPELVISAPQSEKSGDQTIYLVDGSEIQLKHAKIAGHLKGVSVVDILWTEVTECLHEEAYVISVARTVDTGGQLFLDSTPKAGHWMKDSVIDIAHEQREALKRGEINKLTIKTMSMSSLKNPWVSREEMILARAVAAKTGEQIARREFDGEWVGDNATIFGDIWDGSIHIVDMPVNEPDLGIFGLRDITKQASRKWFRGSGHDWVIGVDVNRNPHTAVVCKIFGNIHDPKTWGLYIHDEVRTWDTDAYGAAKHLSRSRGGMYKGGGVAIDANAAHPNQHAAHTNGRATTPVKDYKRLGFNARPPTYTSKNGKAKNPDVLDSTAVVRHLMRERVYGRPRFLVNSICTGTIKAIEQQEDRGDGRPVKESNTYSDREIAAFTDSIRYLAWPIFNRSIFSKKIRML